MLSLETCCAMGIGDSPSPTYCSAGMYPSRTGRHSTSATFTFPSISSNVSPRFSPRIVTRVPPSRGPLRGVICTKERVEEMWGRALWEYAAQKDSLAEIFLGSCLSSRRPFPGKLLNSSLLLGVKSLIVRHHRMTPILQISGVRMGWGNGRGVHHGNGMTRC